MKLNGKGFILPKRSSPPSHPKIMDKMLMYLKENAHVCGSIVGWDDHQFKWCQKDICEEKLNQDTMAKINTERINFETELKIKGHTCTKYKEIFPIQLSWCEKEICININDKN